MNITLAVKQRGVSFGGFILGAFLLVFVTITGLKVIPVYIQDATIKNLFEVVSNDPDMQNASPREIRAEFEKRASIDDVTAITSADIDIVNNAGKPVLSAYYSVKVPLFANISLLIEFKPTSANK